jgi:hypothetical protein
MIFKFTTTTAECFPLLHVNTTERIFKQLFKLGCVLESKNPKVAELLLFVLFLMSLLASRSCNRRALARPSKNKSSTDWISTLVTSARPHVSANTAVGDDAQLMKLLV